MVEGYIGGAGQYGIDIRACGGKAHLLHGHRLRPLGGLAPYIVEETDCRAEDSASPYQIFGIEERDYVGRSHTPEAHGLFKHLPRHWVSVVISAEYIFGPHFGDGTGASEVNRTIAMLRAEDGTGAIAYTCARGIIFETAAAVEFMVVWRLERHPARSAGYIAETMDNPAVHLYTQTYAGADSHKDRVEASGRRASSRRICCSCGPSRR